MSQMMKTLLFVLVALVLVGAAFLAYPRVKDFQLDSQVNKPLFAKFTDPGLAASVTISKIKEELGELVEFEITKHPDTGIWVIPSHDSYPADAGDRVRDASTALIDLLPIDILSMSSSDQRTYGVIEPSQDIEAAEQGVGLLITMKDESGNKIAELIIGKEGRTKGDDDVLYFVRKPTEDAVYVAKIDPLLFSTKFEDWIKKDLLELDALNISAISVRDYTVPHEVLNSQQGIQIRPDPENLKRRMEADVNWNDTDAKWALGKLVTYQGTTPITSALDELEELNTQKLNDLKNAVADLEIVGVRKKPDGLRADLRAGQDFLNKEDSLISLQTVGFFPWPVNKELELFAENGELAVATKNGVQYLLRFGRTAGIEGDSEKMSRFLMVTARIDESQFADLPAAIRSTFDDNAGDAKIGPTPADTDSKNSNDQETETAKEKNSKPPQPPAPCGIEEEEKGKEKKKAAEKKQEKTPDSTAGKKADPVKKENESPKKDAADTKDKKSPKSNEEPAKKTTKPAADKQKKTQTPAEAAAAETAAKEAQRKQDELRQKYIDARAKVARLNYRFGDWYYIISEDEYRKIHITRKDLIQETASAKDQGFGIDAFRSLQEGGLQPAAPVSPIAPGGFPPGLIPGN